MVSIGRWVGLVMVGMAGGLVGVVRGRGSLWDWQG